MSNQLSAACELGSPEAGAGVLARSVVLKFIVELMYETALRTAGKVDAAKARSPVLSALE